MLREAALYVFLQDRRGGGGCEHVLKPRGYAALFLSVLCALALGIEPKALIGSPVVEASEEELSGYSLALILTER